MKPFGLPAWIAVASIAAIPVFYLCLSVFVGWSAGQKGRSGFGWTLLAFIFTPLLALLALAAVPELEVDERALAAGVAKRCPFCAEVIRIEAAVCPCCGRDVLAEELRPRRFAG